MYIPPVIPGDPVELMASATQLSRAAEAVRGHRRRLEQVIAPSTFTGPAAGSLRSLVHKSSGDLASAAQHMDDAAAALERQATKVAESISAHNAARARAATQG
jgi:hypothetical protein